MIYYDSGSQLGVNSHFRVISQNKRVLGNLSKENGNHCAWKKWKIQFFVLSICHEALLYTPSWMEISLKIMHAMTIPHPNFKKYSAHKNKVHLCSHRLMIFLLNFRVKPGCELKLLDLFHKKRMHTLSKIHPRHVNSVCYTLLFYVDKKNQKVDAICRNICILYVRSYFVSINLNKK